MAPPEKFFQLEDHHKVYFLALAEFVEVFEKVPVSTLLFNDNLQWEKYLRIIEKYYEGSCTKNEDRAIKTVNNLIANIFRTEAWGKLNN